jgi:hypothetical protein
VPDRRKHRGPHQADGRLFAPEAIPALRAAVADLSWLLGRGYRDPSALKLVGDRYRLRQRQREAVRRAACSDEARELHAERFVALGPGVLKGRSVLVDGFNCIVSVEAAMAGGVILQCRDGRHRDLASVHGSYRKVNETQAAVQLLGRALETAGAGPVRWLLDAPISNSGRLRALLVELAAQQGWDWGAELVPDPDRVLRVSSDLCATADGGILDEGVESIDLVGAAIEAGVPEAWLVDLREPR